MAFTRGQVDRFGRPIPASPGVQQIINADGSEVQQRNRLILPDTIVATDSDDNDATVLELTGVPAGSVSLADMAPLAASSVIGNNTGSPATPAAIPATSFGLAALAAVSQAALTALIAVATTSLAGLMSALDKTKLDSLPDKVHSAAYASVTSVATATWTALKYRRIEVYVKNSAGATTSIKLTLTGPAAASYHSKALTISAGGAVNVAGANFWTFDVSGGGGDFSSVDAIVQLIGHKTITGKSVENTGGGTTLVGVNTDTTTPVTGLTVTFSTASSGWLEVIGYQ